MTSTVPGCRPHRSLRPWLLWLLLYNMLGQVWSGVVRKSERECLEERS